MLSKMVETNGKIHLPKGFHLYHSEPSKIIICFFVKEQQSMQQQATSGYIAS